MHTALTDDQSLIQPHLKPLLQLRALVKQFGGFRAVNQLNLTAYPGELHCLIGPNGAGKSTVFKLIMGTYRVTAGSIFFKEQDITPWSTWKRARHGISIKLQIPGVYGELSVRDNMLIAAQHHIDRHQKCEEIDCLLSLVYLDGKSNFLAKDLSHGEQQWLEIGMALSTQPELLLLDEPSAGMGPEETKATGEILKCLHDRGMTILVIEHDMKFVRQIAERVTVLHYGKFFAEGTLSEIEQNEDVIRIYLGKG